MSRKRTILRTSLVLAFLATFGLALSFAQPNVFAEDDLSGQQLDEFSQNDILFYDPSCDSSSGGGSGGICGTNQNYAGEQVYTDEQMEAIRANQPFYEKAGAEYGIPWQIIPAIHVRESGLKRSNPGNGQGVYQFASASERSSCPEGNFSPGAVSDEQFQIQTNCMARRIREVYGEGLDLGTDDGVKKMFFRYNGTAKVYKQQALKLGFTQEQAENGEGSPYVMNRYDAQREPSSTWGQVKRDHGPIEYPANKDFGAFVYYKAISCDGNSSASQAGSSSGPSTISSNGSPSSSASNGSDVTIIGDSITNGSRDKILEKLPGSDIYAEDCKTVGYDFSTPCGGSTGLNKSGLTLVQELKPDNKLRSKVVLLLGTNPGGFDKLTQTLDEIGSDHQIFLMSLWTKNDDYASANETIAKLVGERSNVNLIDWAGAIKNNPDTYLNSDGIHPNESGQNLLADLIKNAVGTNSCVSVGEFTYYDQNDPRWKDAPYGSSTIGPSGCAPTSFAMAATKYLGRSITPEETAKVAGDAGMYISGSGSSPEVIKTLASHYGMEYERLSAPTVDETVELVNKYLKDGWGIIMSGKSTSEEGGLPFTPRGHYVYIRELTSDGKWLVDDSYHSELGQKAGAANGHPFTTIAPEATYDPAELIKNSGRLGDAQTINAVRSTSSATNSDCDSVCSTGGGTGQVSEDGLTYEQAKQLMINYGANKNNSSRDAAGAAMWNLCGGGGSNCATFSTFFVNKFTSTHVSSVSCGLGSAKYAVYPCLSKNYGIPAGDEPKVWAVFAWPNSGDGHTGVILGHHDGKWIVGHASCHRGKSGLRGAGDGTKEGGGSGFVIMDEDIFVAIWQRNLKSADYAYFDDQINFDALQKFIDTGE